MWGMYLMWIMVVITVIMTLILLSGKGSNLVSGFNTMSKEEKNKYDKCKISRQAGIYMSIIDFGLILLALYLQFRVVPFTLDGSIDNYKTEITWFALGISGYIVSICIIASIFGFKKCRKSEIEDN